MRDSCAHLAGHVPDYCQNASTSAAGALLVLVLLVLLVAVPAAGFIYTGRNAR